MMVKLIWLSYLVDGLRQKWEVMRVPAAEDEPGAFMETIGVETVDPHQLKLASPDREIMGEYQRTARSRFSYHRSYAVGLRSPKISDGCEGGTLLEITSRMSPG